MRAALLVANLLLPVLVWTTPARALDPADRTAAQATIVRQLDAFRANDAATAYAQAAPEIRALFETPEGFRAMVERGYGAVINPRDYRFDRTEEAGTDDLAQAVSLQDADGLDWMALYTLHRQSDGQWRITGCTLRKAPGAKI